jgi:hypothetical protein
LLLCLLLGLGAGGQAVPVAMAAEAAPPIELPAGVLQPSPDATPARHPRDAPASSRQSAVAPGPKAIGDAARRTRRAGVGTDPRTQNRAPAGQRTSGKEGDSVDDGPDREDDPDMGLSVPLSQGSQVTGRTGRTGMGADAQIDGVDAKRRALIPTPRLRADDGDITHARGLNPVRRAVGNGLGLGLTFDLPN